MTSEAAFGARLTIDVSALKRNYRSLCERAAPSDVGAAVKGNAYGCGVEHVVPALFDAGCRSFFVAQTVEGIAVRNILGEAKADIYILNGFNAAAAPLYVENELTAVLGSNEELDAWRGLTATKRPTFALHVDTGMNRLGLRFDEDSSIADSANPKLLMTHMACADEPSHPLNALQIDRFNSLRKSHPGWRTSLANSATVLNGWATGYHLARPGIALYGGGLGNGAENPMENVVTVEARVIQVRRVQEGECVGYGATWTASRESDIAIVSAGYADGYLRASGNNTDEHQPFVAIRGMRYPLAGRVSMDLIAVDVTDADGSIKPGIWAELIGPNVHIDQVAKWANTIPYELLTRLGPRFNRRVIDSGSK
ncbi:MAG: alanine racemase [Pseudomonadota bacterium]